MAAPSRYKLVSEHFKKRFGEIYVDTFYQDKLNRIGFLRRATDDAALTYHEVTFDIAGIRALGKHHEIIVKGGLLGQTIKDSGVPHARKDSSATRRKLNRTLQNLFGSKNSYCKSEQTSYWVKGAPYCKIVQFYNPRFTPVPQER